MATTSTVELAARLKLFEDSTNIYNNTYSMNAVTYTKHSVDRLVLSTNSDWQEINLGGVGTGVFMQIRTDRPIQVSLNATTNPWNLGRGTEGGVLGVVSSFTHVYVKNNSTTNQAIVNAVITDENA